MVSNLVPTSAAVLALSRNPESAGLPRAVEVLRGDLSNPEVLEECLDGIEKIFLLWPGLPSYLA